MLKTKRGLPEITGIICEDWRLCVCGTQGVLCASHPNIFLNLFLLVGALCPVWASTFKEKWYKNNLVRSPLSVTLSITRADMLSWLSKQMCPSPLVSSASNLNSSIKKEGSPYRDLPIHQGSNRKQMVHSLWELEEGLFTTGLITKVWAGFRILLNTELQAAPVKQPELTNEMTLFFNVIYIDYC